MLQHAVAKLWSPVVALTGLSIFARFYRWFDTTKATVLAKAAPSPKLLQRLAQLNGVVHELDSPENVPKPLVGRVLTGRA